ncbi:hypothetical protein [Bordetella sp. LUAb4]|uniref:hypothetical protein n=1 Tax=Bordetella sp. LUAb4 TaxID=2843195 RepID=UPI001E35B467|nr:hypothetical protein [Bordetella sp. LUAb4]
MPGSPKRSSSKTAKKTPPAPELQASTIQSPKRRSAAARADSPFATLVKKIKREHGVVVAKPTNETENGWVPLGHERMMEMVRAAGIITASGKLSSRYK